MSETRDKSVTVSIKDLPLACPRPDAPLWAQHPRVFLDVLKEGEVVCPYCSARYVFTGDRPKGHH